MDRVEADRVMEAVAIFCDGSAFPRLEPLSKRFRALGHVIAQLDGHLRHERNPRALAYMEAAAKEAFPRLGRVFDAGRGADMPAIDWENVGTLVLLWPDANGLGWGPLEAAVKRAVDHRVNVVVLNGRRRRFAFGSHAYRMLRRRRLLQKSFACNAVFTLALFLLAPALSVWDTLRGRR